MVKDEYLRFNKMIDRGGVSRATLYRMIKDGKIRVNDVSGVKTYSLKDVINNKPRKK